MFNERLGLPQEEVERLLDIINPIDPSKESPGQDAQQRAEDERAALRESTLNHLAKALNYAAERLSRAASGQSVFQNPFDLTATLALLNLLPDLLPRFEQKPAYNFGTGVPLIPPCPICHKSPGCALA